MNVVDPTRHRARTLSFFAALAAGAALMACAPTLELGCQGDEDCVGDQKCTAGRCTGHGVADLGGGAGGHGGGAGGHGGAGGGAGGHGGAAEDARPARDARPADALFPDDAGRPRPDAGTPTDAVLPGPDASGCPIPEGATVPAEICNGRDDDCDGTVDLDVSGGPLARTCWSGTDETRGVGACRDGVQICARGVFGTCNGEVLSSNELCDAMDNDCDLAIDEDPQGGPLARACYSGDPTTAGVGICSFGAQICSNGLLGPCIGEALPGLEICDGSDNDCNGEPDDVADSEDCGACEPGSVRACYAGAPETLGVGVCQAGEQQCNDLGDGWGPCLGQTPPEGERCDGEDNDCDATVDNNVPGNGSDCVLGVGACATIGEQACGATGLTCRGFEFAPQEERCNSVDDDCDGLTDEDFALGRACASGQGACRAEGATVCATDETATVCEALGGQAGTEDCNGLDDDCDGAVDEPRAGEQALERRCYTGPAGTQDVGPCRAGRQRCDSPDWSACLDETTPFIEICDGVDNDCDGEVDDGLGGGCDCFGGETRACYSGPGGTEDVGACHAGTQVCAAGRFGGCTQETLPGAELCNRADDDCNGRVDDLPAEGNDCLLGVGECQRGGHLRCNRNTGGLDCEGEAGRPDDEICNGLDDDCDGEIDEDFNLGAACSVGTGACTRTGGLVCDDDGGSTCDATPGPPAREVCDGQDNDCDRETDNDAACPAMPLAIPRCERARCQYTCAARAFDGDANLENGCERGCEVAPAGLAIAALNLVVGFDRYTNDLAVVTDPAGTPAVAYVQVPVGAFSSDLVVYTTGQSLRMSRGDSGGYETPTMAQLGGRWVTFANHAPFGGLASDFRFDAGVATPNGLGGFSVATQTWPRLASVVPGAVAFSNANRPTAVAFLVDSSGSLNTSSLRTRVMNLEDASILSDGQIGDATDYPMAGARLLAFPLGDGTAAVSQFVNPAGLVGVRFLGVNPQGAIVGLAETPPVAGMEVSRDFAGALTHGGGTLAHISPTTGHLRYWRLTLDADNVPELSAFDTQIDGASSLSVVQGRAGAILFFRHAATVRALFLDNQHQIVGDLADVLVAGPQESLGVVRVSSNGVRINAAFTVLADAGRLEQLRLAQLNCQ